jgi:predicted nuclease of predicted toxin-antitoxin system
MIFKIDKNLPDEVADRFRRAEYECATVHDEGLVGKSDAIIANVLRSENRLLVTLDVGFANIQR